MIFEMFKLVDLTHPLNKRLSTNSVSVDFGVLLSRFWSTPEAYRNVDAREQMLFPAFSAKSGELLLKRGIVGLGIDTLSSDCLDQEYPIHQLFLGAGKYILENVANLGAMPPKGGYVIALPIRVAGGAEAPVRMVGLVKN
jgi:kynurenine formamidase